MYGTILHRPIIATGLITFPYDTIPDISRDEQSSMVE